MRIGEALRVVRIVTGLVAITLTLLPLQLLALRFGWRLRKTIPQWWHRGFLGLAGIRVHIHGVPAHTPHGLLLAANHVSWLDISILGSITPLSFIAKDEVRDWGVFGKLAQWQETMFIARQHRTKTRQQVAAIGQRLDAGETLVLFPEGTTSDGNFIYRFKSSLFGALGLTGAQADGTHCVQPVAIVYSRLHGQPMGRYDRPLVAWPGDVELLPHALGVLSKGVVDVDVCFGAPIQANAQIDRKKLTAQVQATVSTMAAAALRGRLTPSHLPQSALMGHDDE